MGQFDQHQQTRGALDQRANSAGVAQALDQVTLPLAWELAVRYCWGMHVNAQQLGYLPAPILPFRVRPASGP